MGNLTFVNGAWSVLVTERELHTLRGALCIAADQYRRDAKLMEQHAESVTNANERAGSNRIRDQIQKQERECRELLEKIGGE